MKKYEYVSVKVGSLIGGSGNLEHRAIIDKCSQNGYAYIGYIPTHMDSYGRLKTIDLIFEKIDAPEHNHSNSDSYSSFSQQDFKNAERRLYE